MTIRGDELQDHNFSSAKLTVLNAILESRASWTKNEERYLRALISNSAAVGFQRVGGSSNRNAAKPFADVFKRVTAEIDESLQWNNGEPRDNSALISDPEIVGFHISPKDRGNKPIPGSLHAWAAERFGT